MIESKIFLDSQEKTTDVLLWRDDCWLHFVGDLFVLVLDLLHEMIGTHVVDDSHPQLVLMLDY
jgi:hypothetical protein